MRDVFIDFEAAFCQLADEAVEESLEFMGIVKQCCNRLIRIHFDTPAGYVPFTMAVVSRAALCSRANKISRPFWLML
jgi:DNA-directed RNA polymerase subunit N (RpoN/RPB10)